MFGDNFAHFSIKMYAVGTVKNFKDHNTFYGELAKIFEPHREKPVFGVSDQVQYKSGCTATEDG